MTTALDFFVDPNTGDIRLDGTEIELVTGRDAVAQEIQTVLRWWRNEWFLDTGRGTPWLEAILGKGVSAETVRAILKRQIETVPAVIRVRAMEVSIDAATRVAEITSVDVQTTEGDVALRNVEVGR